MAQVLSNLESVSELLGTLEGMADGIDSDLYVEQLIKDAHNVVKDRFDEAAAATAGAGGFPHMFEYGTPGITRGQPIHADPTSPDARLWTHKITGLGGDQNIWYDFRPAVTRNPLPTTAATGVPSKYLRRLSQRKYVFWNKALVMETGMEVEIRSKRGDKGLIFVPTPGENSPRMHIMYPSKTKGPIIMRPGQNTMGSFTSFWIAWWNSEGAVLLEESMREDLTYDIRKSEKQAAARAAEQTMKPIQTTNLKASWTKAKQYGKKMIFAWK